MLTVKAAVPTIVAVNHRTRRLVAAWLATHRSDNTRDAYERDLVAFARWCDERGTDPLGAGPADLDRYRDDCLSAGTSASTVIRRLSGIASFFRYAAATGRIDHNPADDVERPDLEPPDTAALDDGELASLLEAADVLGPKTAALVSLLALDGLRLGEVLALDVPRVRVEGTKVSVELQRHGERDQVEVAERTAVAVAAYLARRRRGPLFLGERPSPIKASRLSRFGADFLIKRAGTAAGIDKPVSANVLRRSYIDAAHRAGTPLATIARHVGHKEARETARLLESGR